MKKTISIKVYNESGVLTRISTVFSSRGFNIDSIAVGPTENSEISRIILVLLGDNQTIEQITKQLIKQEISHILQPLLKNHCVKLLSHHIEKYQIREY